MSAAPSLSSVTEAAPRRLCPRHAINVALDVITLRSGIPDSVPGRCTDISEAGIGAALAGELNHNQHVAIELKLPQVALPLRARAIVRHHSRLRCGLQFVNLSVEQREMIRFWIHRNTPTAEPEPAENVLSQVASPATTPEAEGLVPRPRRTELRVKIRLPKRRLFVLIAMTLALAAFAWWYWERSWHELENSVSRTKQAQVSVVNWAYRETG